MEMRGFFRTTRNLTLSLAAFTLLGVAGCGSVDDTTSSPSSATSTSTTSTTTTSTSANTTASFTTDGGNYIRYKISSLPATMTFNVQGVDGGDDRDMQPIVYFYDANGFSGGRGGRGFNGDLRNQKLKVYDVNDDLMGSEGERYGYDWNSDATVKCKIVWTESGVTAYVGDAVAEKSGSVASEFTIGIGVPPAVREGWVGITFTDIVWPEGAVEVSE